jgi:hypothetical protein
MTRPTRHTGARRQSGRSDSSSNSISARAAGLVASGGGSRATVSYTVSPVPFSGRAVSLVLEVAKFHD